ncbi:hypothetical protein [Nocardioides bruguierae]|uniref:hypothetical protein n=1 Tax=Nocardioides bruguierae TaxID=2945102 RepID=UPI00202285AD|nr:hypothetical protein [Nocardioides bruguierae]MCL8024610.1 hypothetical protein [Nocardioides bruguierae]
MPLVFGAGSRLRPDERVQVLRHSLATTEHSFSSGLAVTTPERAVLDEARVLDSDRELVVGIDMAQAAAVTTVERLSTMLAATPVRAGRDSGPQRLRRLLDLVVPDSWSPGETRLRLVWEVEAARPRPWRNQRIVDASGTTVAVVDLLDAQAGVVGEYDGAPHRTSAQHRRDVQRQRDLERLGFVVVSAVASDVASGAMRRRLAADVRRAVARARGPEPARRWVAGPGRPPWV